MLLSAASSARAAGATSSRTHCTIASANVQRKVAGGDTTTCVLSTSTIASSRTRSSTAHSPASTTDGSEGAMARSAVSRSRHADGGGGSCGLAASGAIAASTGRGRGRGTARAAASPPNMLRTTSAQRSFTAAIRMRIAALWRLVGTGACPRWHDIVGQNGPRIMPHFDVIVCGLGVMGSAAVRQLARRGKRVLGLERHAPGHDRGSSHGRTRIIRLGYFEHPSYVPLLRRAYALWRDLEAASGRKLLHVTGIAEIGPPAGVLVKGTLAASRLHGLRHEMLAAPELLRRFPAFALPPDYVAVLQPDGGFIEAEPAVAAQIALATAAGAEIRSGERVQAIEPRAGSVRIVTDRGAVEAGTAIVTAGAWTKSLLPDLAAPLRATREVMGWFE